ncbi:MAG: OmpA family protein [Verrucomicrobiales bacterium]|nr:OmpA family protein [Verrucomicrobiales bacterium]
MDRVSPPEAAEVQRRGPSGAPDALDQLRQILFGQEKRTLFGLQQRLDDPVLHAEDVSRVLPRAVARCARRDDRLAHAMAPAVESALKSSVKRDPGILTNAIFPIIGPAIRKALAESFGRLVQSFNHALEHSLSWRGLKWRVEAWRTGRPFAEVVLYHTLVFRVEQVFLIHQPTGLLLQHVLAPEVQSNNEDVISGMLTAVQSFVRDSFRVGPGGELQTIRVGELDVWVEAGPHAALAFVIRGRAPEEFRQKLVDTLEGIHRDEALALSFFKGDTTVFQFVRPRLEECLKTQLTGRSRKSAMSVQMLIVSGVVILAAVGWSVVRWRDSARREGFIAALREEPGFVIIETALAHGKWRVTGLKDPLARDPVELASQAGLDVAKLEFRWEPYLALNAELLRRRARARLTPPPGVEMEVQAGALVLRGTAPENWWREAQSAALRVPGIDRVDGTQLRLEAANSDGADRARAQVLKDELKNSILYFAHAQAALTNQPALIATVARAASELAQLARADNASITLVITGHADRTGSEDFNLALSRQRAESVRQRLIETGLPREMLATVGAGSSAPTQGASPGADSELDRRVTFSVLWQR